MCDFRTASFAASFFVPQFRPISSSFNTCFTIVTKCQLTNLPRWTWLVPQAWRSGILPFSCFVWRCLQWVAYWRPLDLSFQTTCLHCDSCPELGCAVYMQWFQAKQYDDLFHKILQDTTSHLFGTVHCSFHNWKHQKLCIPPCLGGFKERNTGVLTM